MKIKGIFVALASLLLCASCTTLKKTSTTVAVQNVVCTSPTVADLEVLDKVELRKEWNFRPFHIGEPKMAMVKGNLISESLQKLDADVLLEPQVNFSRTSYGARVLVITGYPAKYKNFHKATDKELEAIKAYPTPNKTNKLNTSGGLGSRLIGIFKKQIN